MRRGVGIATSVVLIAVRYRSRNSISNSAKETISVMLP